jgi:hypothetical protein
MKGFSRGEAVGMAAQTGSADCAGKFVLRGTSVLAGRLASSRSMRRDRRITVPGYGRLPIRLRAHRCRGCVAGELACWPAPA